MKLTLVKPERNPKCEGGLGSDFGSNRGRLKNRISISKCWRSFISVFRSAIFKKCWLTMPVPTGIYLGLVLKFINKVKHFKCMPLSHLEPKLEPGAGATENGSTPQDRNTGFHTTLGFQVIKLFLSCNEDVFVHFFLSKFDPFILVLVQSCCSTIPILTPPWWTTRGTRPRRWPRGKQSYCLSASTGVAGGGG